MAAWRLRDRVLEFPPPLGAGIVNVTHDSFFEGARSVTPQRAVDDGLRLVEAGFDLLDVGAVAARSGPPVEAADEAAGLVPAIEGLVARAGVPVLADTFSAEVASRALDAGAAAINDISGAADPDLLAAVAEAGSGYVLMHIEGPPRADREPGRYDDPVEHLLAWFAEGLERAVAAGVAEEAIALDPGLDFDLSVEDDLQILRRLGELRALGRPLFVALSRKDFLGAVLAGSWEDRLDASARDAATMAATALAVAEGAEMLRLHDPEALDAMRVAAAIALHPGGAVIEEAWLHLVEAGGADERLVSTSTESGRPAETAPVPRSLDSGLAAALRAAGVERLYSHQLEALDAAREGNAIITSGTASGKSLSFNLPTLEGLAADERARALYLYPTKALAQDQARKLSELGAPGLRHAIYDGDTPREDRPQIRRRSNLVLTNPDMLNMSVLPHHKHWGDFLSGLRWVVVDEAHTYRGVFGSHVANVLRRLRRVARLYGSEPRFLCASATIANPVELAQALVGERFRLVDSDGAPRAGRRVAIWNPPVIDPKTMRRRSVLSESAELLADLVIAGMRTICFLRSRRGIELIQRFTRMRLEDLGHPQLAERIAPYRAGYTPQQRRDIEARLARGELLAVVATDALELGIDIGELDAAICVTFPGTVASLRQMWGRAGRRREGIALYVAGDDALDQFFCRHPDEFIGRPVEAAILDHANERIQLAHTLAAAYEVPLGGSGEQPGARDDEILGPRWRERADALVAAGQLRRSRDGRYLPRGPGFPAGEISLRSASPDSVAVIERVSGELLGSVEAERAFTTVHPGAIYLHLGRSYEVRELDVENRRAVVDPFDGDWYTQPKKETMVYIERVGATRHLGIGHGDERRADPVAEGAVELSFGEVSVTEQVIAYQRKRLEDHGVIDLVALDLPETNFPTQALWYVLPDALAGPEALPLEVQLGALHATEHSQIAVLPLLAMCDRWDIGGLSTNVHFQTGAPTIFIYDGHPGGVGISRRGYEEFERLVADAARLVGECPCAEGCPSCVQSPKCGNLNEPLHKAGALQLMEGMINAIAAAARPARA